MLRRWRSCRLPVRVVSAVGAIVAGVGLISENKYKIIIMILFYILKCQHVETILRSLILTILRRDTSYNEIFETILLLILYNIKMY